MALRSGYKGFKKLAEGLKMIRPGILSVDNAALSSTFFPRSEQAVLGAKNLVNFTVDEVLVKSTRRVIRKYTDIDGRGAGIYRLSFKVKDIDNFLSTPEKMGCRIDSGSSPGSTAQYMDVVPDGTQYDFIFNINDTADPTKKLSVYFFINNNQADTATFTVYDVMLTLATDTDINYVPYSMTNQELTASAADQKTAINAIITAATGAADFAAFKAAMEAITPVTRSLSRTASPEDVPEEVIEEKTVTKKTTKKTVKEGE